MTREEANEALDRLFDYCEEIDNHIPEEERTGYDMLPDIQALRKFVFAENKGFDGMTNGEVIQALFPELDTHDFGITVHATERVTCCGDKHCRGSISYDFWKEWWNAPYQKGGE